MYEIDHSSIHQVCAGSYSIKLTDVNPVHCFTGPGAKNQAHEITIMPVSQYVHAPDAFLVLYNRVKTDQ